MTSIVPAIIPQSLEHAQASLRAIQNIHEVHIDIVDGQFVKPVSWPINPAGDIADISEELAIHSVEVDIMTASPIIHAEQWQAQMVDMIVLHAETLSVQSFTNFVASAKCSIGISALLDTSYDELKPYLDVADYVQVMGIGVIGAQGQPFDDRAIDRIHMIAADYPKLPISIDGSVNTTTIPKLSTLPIDRFIVGSAIMGAETPEHAYTAMKALLNHTL